MARAIVREHVDERGRREGPAEAAAKLEVVLKRARFVTEDGLRRQVEGARNFGRLAGGFGWAT